MLDALRTQLAAGGCTVDLQYVLAVPAARYGEFRDELLALHAAHTDPQGVASQPWVDEMTWEHGAKKPAPGDEIVAGASPRPRGPRKDTPAAEPVRYRLVVAQDPQAAQRPTLARRAEIQALVALGEQWGGKLDEQDARQAAEGGKRARGRPLSDSGAKARLYHAVKDAGLAHLVQVDLKSELFQFTIDEARQQYLERLDGKLLLVTNSDAPAAEVVQRYKSLADIERGFRALKSNIEIGPVYHGLPRRVRAHALVCFLASILHQMLRMRLRANRRDESPATLLEQLNREQRQTARTADGHELRGLTELGSVQKDLFAALGVAVPNPAEIVTPHEPNAPASL